MTCAGGPRVVLIDGRSGSGKTSLAARIAERLGTPANPAQVLHLDSLYPGWDGLSAGARSVSAVLQDGSYRRYDWGRGEFEDSRILLDQGRPLVIEGCGALTTENLRAARAWSGNTGSVRSIWIECPEELRKRRALGRDGATFAPHWDRWASQEDLHFAEHEPWRIADEAISSE